MSDLNAFLDKAKGDDALKSKLSEAGSPADVVAMGAEAGFHFSEADLEEASKGKMSSGEVSQADLDNVSGGTITISPVLITLTVCR